MSLDSFVNNTRWRLVIWEVNLRIWWRTYVTNRKG